MNTYNMHNPSEMLHLLVDGELDTSLETPLYSALLESDELRNELRELIALRESMRKDVEAFTPPVAATQNIFRQLGYTVPVPPVANIETAASAGFLTLLKQKLWNPVVTAISAAIITALLFLNLNINESNSVANAGFSGDLDINNKIKISKTENIESEKIQLPIISSRETEPKEKIVYVNRNNDNNVKETADKEEPINNDIYTQSEHNDKTTEDAFTADFLNDINTSSYFYIPMKNLKLLSGNNKNSDIREFNLSNNIYQSSERRHALLLQVKAMSGTSFPSVDINTLSDKLISNFSIGAFIPIGKNYHFGFEVGQEPFSQIYDHIEDNKLYRIEQNPVLWWIGAGLKISSDKHLDFLANAQPFLNLTIAGTKVGPYGKAIAGLQFISDNGFGITLGLEGSSLVYENQGRWYSTEKIGITYGMFMKLF